MADDDNYQDPAAPLTRDEAEKVDVLTEVGFSGLRQSGGYIREEFLKQLSFRQGNRTYREMADNDPTVGGLLYALEALMRQTEWSIQPALAETEGDQATEGDREQSAEDVKWMRGILFEDMDSTWDQFLGNVATMFTYGFAPFEPIFKVRRGYNPDDPRYDSKFEDGTIGLRDLALRQQYAVERWDFTDDGNTWKGFYQQTYNGKRAYIPRERIVLFRTKKVADNPEGRSLLRNAYRPWYFKNRIEETEAIGIERDLAGLPVMRIPSAYMRPDADENHKATYNDYKKIVTQVVRDESEGLVLPSDRDEKGHLQVELELLTSGGSRQFDTSAIVSRYDQRIAIVVLADFLFLGTKSTGSFALAETKVRLFMSAAESFLNEILSVINRQVIPALYRLNGKPTENMVRLTHTGVDRPDLLKLAALIKSLTGTNMLDDQDLDLVNRIREVSGMPPTTQEELDRQAAEREAEAQAAHDQALELTEAKKPDPGDVDPDQDVVKSEDELLSLLMEKAKEIEELEGPERLAAMEKIYQALNDEDSGDE